MYQTLWLSTYCSPVQVSQLESELRVAATKHEVALEGLRLQHQQVSTAKKPKGRFCWCISCWFTLARIGAGAVVPAAPAV